MADSLEWGSYTLYLAPDGTHCVLFGDCDPNYEESGGDYEEYMVNQTESEQKEARTVHARGEKMALAAHGDLGFAGGDFEEWLARYHLRTWCEPVLEEKGASFDDLETILQEYIVENYSERGYM